MKDKMLELPVTERWIIGLWMLLLFLHLVLNPGGAEILVGFVIFCFIGWQVARKILFFACSLNYDQLSLGAIVKNNFSKSKINNILDFIVVYLGSLTLAFINYYIVFRPQLGVGIQFRYSQIALQVFAPGTIDAIVTYLIFYYTVRVHESQTRLMIYSFIFVITHFFWITWAAREIGYSERENGNVIFWSGNITYIGSILTLNTASLWLFIASAIILLITFYRNNKSKINTKSLFDI